MIFNEDLTKKNCDFVCVCIYIYIYVFFISQNAIKSPAKFVSFVDRGSWDFNRDTFNQRQFGDQP